LERTLRSYIVCSGAGLRGELSIYFLFGMEDADAAWKAEFSSLEGERRGEIGRLCVFRFVGLYNEDLPNQEPREVRFLSDVLPDGSSFVCCGIRKREGEYPSVKEWVIWNVVVLCGSQLREEEWRNYRAKVADGLSMPCELPGHVFNDIGCSIVPEEKEVEALSEEGLEAQLLEAMHGVRKAVWMGSFGDLRDELLEAEKRFDGRLEMWKLVFGLKQERLS
jgi:hypothetical protein